MKGRGLKVLGVGWHSTHQYSLSHLPFFERYDLVVEPWRRGFATTQRPMPDNMGYVNYMVPNYYDFALLHIDQQSLVMTKKGEFADVGDSQSKSMVFDELLEGVRKVDPKLPIIIINHMTPFHDRLESDEVISRMKEKTKDCIMICNSYDAQKQWGFGEVITHGLDHTEWGFDVEYFNKTGIKREPDKEPRVVIVLSPAGMEKAYRREFAHAVVRNLEDLGVPYTWVGVTKKFNTFDDYRDFMARSLVQFFPAWQSPRPRSRTEGMLSGQCIVTTPYQDASTFIKSGMLKQKKEEFTGKILEEHLVYDDTTNGFLTNFSATNDPRTMDNPVYTADLLRHLVIDEPEIARMIGQRGKQYAIENFSRKSYEDQWRNLLKKYNLYKGDC